MYMYMQRVCIVYLRMYMYVHIQLHVHVQYMCALTRMCTHTDIEQTDSDGSGVVQLRQRKGSGGLMDGRRRPVKKR